MSRRDEQETGKNSGNVEIVADQSDDGSYELRVSRHAEEEEGGETPDRGATPTGPRTTVLRAEASADGAPATSGRNALPLVLGGILLVGLVAVAILLVPGRGSRSVATVEVAEPEFTGYVVEQPQLVVDEIRIRDEGNAAGASLDEAPEQNVPPEAQPAPRSPGLRAVERRRAAPSRAAAAPAPEMNAAVMNALLQATEEQEEPVEPEPVDEPVEEEFAEDEYADDEFYEDEDEYYDDEYVEDEFLEDEYYEEDEYYDDEAY